MLTEKELEMDIVIFKNIIKGKEYPYVLSSRELIDLFWHSKKWDIRGSYVDYIWKEYGVGEWRINDKDTWKPCIPLSDIQFPNKKSIYIGDGTFNNVYQCNYREIHKQGIVLQLY